MTEKGWGAYTHLEQQN